MFFTEFLRRFKITYEVFNFFNQPKLEYLKAAYKKYGIKKPVYSTINADFLQKNGNAPDEKPWLDQPGAKDKLTSDKTFTTFSPQLQQQVLNFTEKGFAVIPGFLSEKGAEQVNQEIDRIIADKTLPFRYGGKKLMFANKHSQVINSVTHSPELIKLLSFLLGKKVIPFQTINFIKGSEQRAHSDTVHMATYPLGFMIAVWVALEDIKPESGPLIYYPGSHKLPYVMNNDYDSGSTDTMIGKYAYKKYEDKIEEVIKANNLKPATFLPKKGDIFIWHANLLHGGSIMTDTESTRKSMVIHYYCENVICYHEITQRPALLEP